MRARFGTQLSAKFWMRPLRNLQTPVAHPALSEGAYLKIAARGQALMVSGFPVSAGNF
jgi:hypothetical protein